MQDECLICGAPLEYLPTERMMECALCHKKEQSKTRCTNGHYVCNACHTKGVDSIFAVCRTETSKDPVEILNRLMELSFCHMHGPEHHILVGCALLTAYKNSGGEIDLDTALAENEKPRRAHTWRRLRILGHLRFRGQYRDGGFHTHRVDAFERGRICAGA